MPKVIKELSIYTEEGENVYRIDSSGVEVLDQRTFETTNCVYYNKLGESIWKNVNDKSVLPEGYKIRVQTSDIYMIVKELALVIGKGDFTRLGKLLNLDFIYPGIKAQTLPGDMSGPSYSTGYSESYETMPVMEVLIYENPLQFLELIELLIKQDNPTLSQDMCNSLNDHQLGSLLLWNESVKKKVTEAINEVECYTRDLSREADVGNLSAFEKCNKLRSIVACLRNMVANKQDNASVPHHRAQLMNLRFNLQLLASLHEHDADLANRRGYKRCIVNFLSIACTFGIANAYNKFTTGNFLFFNNTTSVEKTLNVQAALGVSPSSTFVFGRN